MLDIIMPFNPGNTNNSYAQGHQWDCDASNK